MEFCLKVENASGDITIRKEIRVRKVNGRILRSIWEEIGIHEGYPYEFLESRITFSFDPAWNEAVSRLREFQYFVKSGERR